MHGGLLISRRQNQTKQLRRPVCRSLRLVLSDARIASHHDPFRDRIFGEHPDPSHICSVATARQILDVMGGEWPWYGLIRLGSPRGLVKCNYRRRPSSGLALLKVREKVTARLIEATGTSHTLEALSCEPSARASFSTETGTLLFASSGRPKHRCGSITMPALRPAGHHLAGKPWASKSMFRRLGSMISGSRTGS